jgi:tetratricopeptide (TPR) repeat protein
MRPSYTEAVKNLANALNKVGAYAEAIEQYKRLLELDPGNTQARQASDQLGAP